MGTRGAFGVIIGEQEKIGYNQYDSYPDGKGLENLAWLRSANLDEVWRLAEECHLVTDKIKPTQAEIKQLSAMTDLNVGDQSTDDWYCLTRHTHGSIEDMLKCGFIADQSGFPLDSLFCEWGYIVDLDRNLFEVYEGFQAEVPKQGRWAGRPTAEEDKANFKAHLAYCKKEGREPFRPEVSEFKAIELIASWPLDELPSDEHFLSETITEREVEEAIG